MLIHTHFAQLLPLYLRERRAGRGVVLATLIHTAGSTYRKAGAQMLIAQNGEYAGLLSGGCLEGDLREHAQRVMHTNEARLIQYDMRSVDDLFGLGAGCAGAMEILLQPVSDALAWQPLAEQHRAWRCNEAAQIGLVVRSTRSEWPVGAMLLTTDMWISPNQRSVHGNAINNAVQLLRTGTGNAVLMLDADTALFNLHSPPAPRLLILGAGPDAQPLATLTHFLGWKATIYDHRSAYISIERFPDAEQLITARPEQLRQQVQLHDYHAIVVMSHHLDSDRHYLREISQCQTSYIGLLGPAARRERLFNELGPDFATFRERLHAPIGLAIGACTPEGIALAIMGEIHAVLARSTP